MRALTIAMMISGAYAVLGDWNTGLRAAWPDLIGGTQTPPPPCVDGVGNSTDPMAKCPDKIVTTTPPGTNNTLQTACINSLGTEIETLCKATKTNNSKLCNNTQKTCSGNAFARVAIGTGPFSGWVDQGVACKLTYNVADDTTKTGTCTPAP
jgi:hypothetical protein